VGRGFGWAGPGRRGLLAMEQRSADCEGRAGGAGRARRVQGTCATSCSGAGRPLCKPPRRCPDFQDWLHLNHI
jgi:hypothetical protein